MPQWDLSLLQFLLFPFFLLFIARVCLFDTQVPRSLILFALVGGLSGLGFAFSFDHRDGGVLFARMPHDTYEMKSHVLREEINGILRQFSSERVQRYFRTTEQYTEVAELFRKYPALHAVLWGNPNWLNISFAPTAKKGILQTPLGDHLPSWLDFKFVTWVPTTGLSLNSPDASIHFTGALLAGTRQKESSWDEYQYERQKLEEERQLNALYDAAYVNGAWTALGHRSFVWWKIGNHHMFRILEKGRYDEAEMACALRAWSLARRNIRPLDHFNSELRGAIENNMGVAFYLQALETGNHQSLKMAKSLLKSAIATKRLGNPFEVKERASEVAHANFKVVAVDRKKRQHHHKDSAGTHKKNKAPHSHHKGKHAKH